MCIAIFEVRTAVYGLGNNMEIFWRFPILYSVGPCPWLREWCRKNKAKGVIPRGTNPTRRGISRMPHRVCRSLQTMKWNQYHRSLYFLNNTRFEGIHVIPDKEGKQPPTHKLSCLVCKPTVTLGAQVYRVKCFTDTRPHGTLKILSRHDQKPSSRTLDADLGHCFGVKSSPSC